MKENFRAFFTESRDNLRKLRKLVKVVKEIVELELSKAADDGLSKEIVKELLKNFEEEFSLPENKFTKLEFSLKNPRLVGTIDLEEYRKPEQIADLILENLLLLVYRPKCRGKDV